MRVAHRGVLALVAIIGILLGRSAKAENSLSALDLRSETVLGGISADAPGFISLDFQVHDVVAAPGDLGDMNDDDSFDVNDILPFELALCDSAAFLAQYNVPDYEARGDFDGDGDLDNFDIIPMGVALDAAIPEPSAVSLAAFGLTGLIVLGRRVAKRRTLGTIK